MIKHLSAAFLALFVAGITGCSADASSDEATSDNAAAHSTTHTRVEAACEGAPILRGLKPHPSYPVATDWNLHDVPSKFWSDAAFDGARGTFRTRIPLAEADGEASSLLVLEMTINSDLEVVASMIVRHTGADESLVEASTWGTQNQAFEGSLNLEVIVPAGKIENVGKLRCSLKLVD